MNTFKILVEFLGENNVEKLREGIVDIILSNIDRDFENYDHYMIDPDEISEFVYECKDEAFKRVKEELIADMEKEMKEKLLKK